MKANFDYQALLIILLVIIAMAITSRLGISLWWVLILPVGLLLILFGAYVGFISTGDRWRKWFSK